MNDLKKTNTGDDAPPKISVRDVSVHFADPRKSGDAGGGIQVLQNINLDIREGEFVCIVGPSGCGKSTLLNIIGGFLKPTAGQVLVNGSPVAGPHRKRIFIFQENTAFPWMTVEENIGFGLFDKPADERARIVAHYIKMVGLTGFEKVYPRELSGGMKQRVEIARALAADPDVLYMDEPFGALDFLTRLRMRSELVQIWQREKKTVIFVTHDVEESVQLADRVVVMSQRPAAIRMTIDVDLPRPRDLDSPEYLSIRDEIFEVMGLDHLGRESSGERGPAEPAQSLIVHTPKKLDADVIIIGGGPAGSVLASYLARAGVNHLIIDKVHHPRSHVGESLAYSTTAVLDDIDFLPVMHDEEFIIKRGVSWTSWYDQRQIDLMFSGLGDPDYSFQVDRARFDDLLLRHARERGTRMFSGGHVERVNFDRHGFASGITAKLGESRFTLRSRIVVDASGRESLLGRQFRMIRQDPEFSQFAVHSWFSNVNRGGLETADFTHIHLLRIPRGWAWQVPINDDVTSVGVVTDRGHFVKSGEDINQFFNDTMQSNPILVSRMRGAKRLREYRMDGNYSYSMERFVGNGWLLAGDAAFFIDPIFSAGISDALQAARFAAPAIIAALSQNDASESAFLEYEERIKRGAATWREFVRLFYQIAPIFPAVVAGSEHRQRLLHLCEGAVYDDAASETMALLRGIVAAIRDAADHPLRKTLAEAATEISPA